MMLKTFKKGGIHPAENKLSADKAIINMPIPNEVTIQLAQSLGSPAKALVNKGDFVKTGQLIGNSDGFISANIHSSVTGNVIKIDEVEDINGYKKTSIIIATEPDQWVDTIDLSTDIRHDCPLSPQEIIDKIHLMGIVGLGGATFPTKVKLMAPQGKKAEILIINGVECEPYLTSDHRLMLEKGEQILIGASILMKALQVEKCVIGIEANKNDAIIHLSSLISKFKGISIVSLKVKYPQGAEKQLIKAITGREVPSGKLPIEVGCVVNNVGTAYAVYEAIQKNKPLIDRVVTLSGKNLKSPANYCVRIGTPINELINQAGGIPEDTAKIVSGGPMMGKSIVSINSPITKGTSGILFYTQSETKRINKSNCIRCGRCISVCPMGLEPYLLEKLIANKIWEDAEKNRIMDCMECGSCQYTCPAGRELLDYLRLGKNTVGKIIRTRVNK